MCASCNETFHCDCVDFCSGLSKLSDITFFCTNWIYKTFIPFVDYIFGSYPNLATTNFNKQTLTKLYDEFSISGYSQAVQQVSLPLDQINQNFTDFNFSTISQPNAGIRNTQSNCWLNSALQCLATTPLCQLLEKWSGHSGDIWTFIFETTRSLKLLASPTKKYMSMELEDRPLNITQWCAMIPNMKEHKDSSEFINLLLNRIEDQLPVERKQELGDLFKLTTLELNRCLVPECRSLCGKTNTTYNVMLRVPVSPYSIRLHSLLWTKVYGRFSTENDEVCSKCAEGKPVVHHSELALSIPSSFIVSINRTAGENHAKIHTPVVCDKVLNLRGIDANHFYEKDVNFDLRAAFLHKGPTISFGHFVSCVFNIDHTVFIYDDEAVSIVNSETLTNSNDFRKNVCMCFYARQAEKPIQRHDEIDRSEDEQQSVPWKLSSQAQSYVKQIWTYKKELFYDSDKISSYHLQTLKDRNWLSGDVISSFLHRMRNKYCDNSQICVFPTYLYTALENPLRKGGIVSSALSVNPFRYNMLVFPINTGDHWSLMICYPNSSMLVCLDSLLVTNLSAFTRIISFIKATFTSRAYRLN